MVQPPSLVSLAMPRKLLAGNVACGVISVSPSSKSPAPDPALGHATISPNLVCELLGSGHRSPPRRGRKCPYLPGTDLARDGLSGTWAVTRSACRPGTRGTSARAASRVPSRRPAAPMAAPRSERAFGVIVRTFSPKKSRWGTLQLMPLHARGGFHAPPRPDIVYEIDGDCERWKHRQQTTPAAGLWVSKGAYARRARPGRRHATPQQPARPPG